MATSPAPFDDSQKSALVQQIISGSLSLQQACAQHGLSTEQLKDWVRQFRRAVRQAIDQRLRSTLSVQGLDLDELSRAEFSGSLADISVADLLQTVQMGHKDAHITLAHGRELSDIWCRAGEVVDAKSGSLEGEAAFYRISSVGSGSVVADFAPVTRPRRIRLSTPRLLLEAASSSGLWERVLQRIGDPGQVFRVRTTATARRAKPLEAEELDVLSLFDGVRSVEEIILASGLPDARALDIVAGFREQGLLVEPTPPSSQRDSSAPISSITMTYPPLAGSVPSAPARPSTWLLASGALLCSSLGAISAVVYVSASAPAGVMHSVPGEPRAHPPPPATQGARGPEGNGGAGEPAPPTAHAAAAALDPGPLGASRATPVEAPRCPRNMVWLEAGQFTMGSNSKRPALSLAKPAHRVSVSGFCLDRHEVTAAEYAACVDNRDCTPAHQTAHFAAESQEDAESSAFITLHGKMCNGDKAGRQRHPINCISHAQATRYCEANDGRLPTEAEWEFAARGSETRAFPWGSSKPTRVHVNACGKECERWHSGLGSSSEVHGLMYAGDDGYAGTAPVGSFPLGSTRQGVEDLIGNVFEWTSGGLYNYERTRQIDPKGPKNADSFVIRGGNFNSGLREFADPALRFAMHRDSYSHGVGFRCAADASTTDPPSAMPQRGSTPELLVPSAPNAPAGSEELTPGVQPARSGSSLRSGSGP